MTPQNIAQAMKLAEMMANSTLIPTHLQGKSGDCFQIIEQAMRWQMSPFAVAQSSSVISGKLMFEGKLVAAAVNNSGLLSKTLDCRYEGTGENRSIYVFGTLKGEPGPREIGLYLRDARTKNAVWTTQPDQQLFYAGARVWARRHTPEVMLGVYTPDEVPHMEPAESQPERNVTPEPEALPEYPTESFDHNFEAWAQAIRGGKKSPDQIIAKVSSKGQLSDDQKQQIRDVADETAEQTT